MKKLIKLSALVALLALALIATGCNNDKTAAAPEAKPAVSVGVSALKADPEAYLGPVSIYGNAANIYTAEGVVEIADDKACCAVYLFVPFNETQNAQLKAKSLYQGNMPTRGAKIVADAVLSKVDDGYFLDVVSIKAGEQTLISKI